MNLSSLSIKRPIFITCIVILMIAGGIIAQRKMPVDLFPNVEFPFVQVMVTYPGAGPQEMENLVARPIEEEISTISGVKKINSQNSEGFSLIFAKFELDVDVKDAEQQIRDRISAIRKKLPKEIDEPTIKRFDPADQPIVMMALRSKLPPKEIFDVADDEIRPMFESVNKVSSVQIFGGRKREIQVQLDRAKLREYEISPSQVADKLGLTGENIPLGKSDKSGKQVIFRAVGEFSSVKVIEDVIVKFLGNDVPIRIKNIGKVVDAEVDETNRAYSGNEKTLVLAVFRQSGANTVKVAQDVKNKIPQINKMLSDRKGNPEIVLIRDGSKQILNNLVDVKESIFLGILLAIVVVFLFLANFRSTIITGLALPNSLIGAFVFIGICGFSINTLTLLAMSLAVGLLIDDAIVVRENIFRHLEMGKTPAQAAADGTKEVTLAVIATTLTVVAVFGSLAFVGGITGRFMREFGLTVVFAMLISLWDGLAVAPMLSAYFSGVSHKKGEAKTGLYHRTFGRVLDSFNRFQDRLEEFYAQTLEWVLKHPLKLLLGAFVLFALSVASCKFIPKTFIPAADNGEISINIDLPPGTPLDEMEKTALKVRDVIQTNQEVELAMTIVGSRRGASNEASYFVRLVDMKKRKLTTSQFKDKLRDELKVFSYANPQVKDYDMTFGGQRPLTVNIIGHDIKQIEDIGYKLLEKLKLDKNVKDPDVGFRPGMPELQIELNTDKASQYGVSSKLMGADLRAQIEGVVGAKFREDGREYDVRVRLQEDQRELTSNFSQTQIPNLNYRMINLPLVATAKKELGSTMINRVDRNRYVQVSADIDAKAGLGTVMDATKRILEKEIGLPKGVRYAFEGQGEEFGEMLVNMAIAAALGVLFIYLVLSSLYESFITPFSIMLALPLAICGAAAALLMTGESINLFSIIACIMLLGIATKNSILLVDYTMQLEQKGVERREAIIQAGKRRLRPILMTSMALLAGALPLAIGLNEASAQRKGMGIAMIGGVISSTILTLIVVPAAYSYIEKFKEWLQKVYKKTKVDV